MYYSEYLRNKQRAAAKVISPPTGRDSSLWTQIKRYKNAGPVVTPLSAGQMLELSADAVIASKANASVCCTTMITAPTTLPATCCDLVVPALLPTNFYTGNKQDCCAVNLPPVKTKPCCDSLPRDSFLIRYRKRPTTSR